MRAVRRFTPLKRSKVSITAIAVAGVASWSAAYVADATPEPSDPPARFEPGSADSLDSDIASRLEALRRSPGSWGWTELVERGRLAVAEGDLPGACSAFEMAVQSSSNDEERVVARYCWGTALLAAAQALDSPEEGAWDQVAETLVGRDEESDPRRKRMIRLAGQVLNEAQRTSPYSRDIAAGRVMAWSTLGDEVETIAAEHQLRVIDPSMEGTARNDFAAAARIVLAVCEMGRIVLLSIDLDGLLEPEQRVALLKLMDSGAETAQAALKLTETGGPK